MRGGVPINGLVDGFVCQPVLMPQDLGPHRSVKQDGQSALKQSHGQSHFSCMVQKLFTGHSSGHVVGQHSQGCLCRVCSMDAGQLGGNIPDPVNVLLKTLGKRVYPALNRVL